MGQRDKLTFHSSHLTYLIQFFIQSKWKQQHKTIPFQAINNFSNFFLPVQQACFFSQAEVKKPIDPGLVKKPVLL